MLNIPMAEIIWMSLVPALWSASAKPQAWQHLGMY
jgi:hypothetical protein